MGGAPRVISITAPPARSAAAQGDLIGSKESVQQLQTDEAQIVNEIEEVQRVIKEEVRDDWMERWEERLRKKLDRHAKEGVRDGAWKCTKLEAGKARDEGKDEGGDSEDEDREGEWDWAGAGREQREGGGEDDEHEVWLHRGDDSDLLLPTDVFLISARKRSPSPPRSSLSLAQQGDSGSVVSPKQGWGSSVSRFIEGIGFISGTTTVPYQPLTTSAASTASGAVLSAPASLSPSPLPSGPGRITSPLLAQGEHKRMESSPQLDLGGPEGNPGLKCWMERRDAWTGADKEGRVRVGRSKFVEVSRREPILGSGEGSWIDRRISGGRRWFIWMSWG